MITADRHLTTYLSANASAPANNRRLGSQFNWPGPSWRGAASKSLAVYHARHAASAGQYGVRSWDRPHWRLPGSGVSDDWFAGSINYSPRAAKSAIVSRSWA